MGDAPFPARVVLLEWETGTPFLARVNLEWETRRSVPCTSVAALEWVTDAPFLARVTLLEWETGTTFLARVNLLEWETRRSVPCTSVAALEWVTDAPFLARVTHLEWETDASEDTVLYRIQNMSSDMVSTDGESFIFLNVRKCLVKYEKETRRWDRGLLRQTN
jgi:hypothetical protein